MGVRALKEGGPATIGVGDRAEVANIRTYAVLISISVERVGPVIEPCSYTTPCPRNTGPAA